MSDSTRLARAEKKALLSTKCELDRHRVMLAVHEIRGIVSPSSVEDRAATIRPFASTLLSILGPVAGVGRLSRWLRFASLGMTALRIARDWRRPR